MYGPDYGVLASIRESLAALLPERVAIALWGLDTTDESLIAPEDKAVARAVDARKREFARGRACARAALRSLGVSPLPVEVGTGRQPVWPRGFVGSITHGGGVIAAAVASTDHILALGIDIESTDPLPDSVRRAVVQPEDRLGDTEEADKCVFSAKESVFKATFPDYAVWMEFDSVFLEHGPGNKELRAKLTGRGAAPPGVVDLAGGYRTVSGRLVTAFWRKRTDRGGRAA